ncbi:MAG: LacI family DNA-binding transcriptional regulator [Sphingomonadaceae bacterium]
MSKASSQRMTAVRPPTIIDVARRAGVSKSAVSRAFTGGSVSEDTRERVLKAASELRYRPSHSARSLKTNRSRLIGLAVTHLDNQFYPEVIEKFSGRLACDGCRVVLFVTRGEAGLEPMIDELLGFGLDGVILASSSHAAEVAAECTRAAMPVIMFNNVDTSGRLPGVCTDNELGAAIVADHLIGLGHSSIAIIEGVPDSSTSRERVTAFRERMLKAGLPDPVLRSGDYSSQGAAQATRELLMAEAPPTAIFCANDHMALAAIETCHELGKAPGRDVSIAGFDDVGIAAWPSFSLTTYKQPVAAMVDACVEGLFAEIAGERMIGETLRLPGELVVRSSTGKN